MANILISDAEKTFILHGVEDDLRCDGRTRCDYRPMEIETGIVTHANGSCRLRLANTDVLVAVKAEIDIPPLENPDEGKIVFFVDCSANAAPEFEGRGGEELAMEFANTLEVAYRSRQAFNLRDLCILPQQRCWKLFVDVLVSDRTANIRLTNQTKFIIFLALDSGMWWQSIRCCFACCERGAIQYDIAESNRRTHGRWKC